jgi:hypothetical protein
MQSHLLSAGATLACLIYPAISAIQYLMQLPG